MTIEIMIEVMNISEKWAISYLPDKISTKQFFFEKILKNFPGFEKDIFFSTT